MNKARRKALESLVNDLEQIKGRLDEIEDGKMEEKELEDFRGKLSDVQSQLETLRDEEQDYYDNMPEGLQAGEKGDKATEAIDNLDNAVNEVETAHDSLDEALGASDSEDKQGFIEAASDESDNAISSIQSAVE